MAGPPGDRSAHRILLSASVDRAAIDAAARAHGWRLSNIYAQRAGRPRQLSYMDASGETLITVVDDYRIGARYVVLAGHDVAPASRDVRATLPSVSLQDVLAMWERPEHRVRAVCWLGVIAPETPAGPALAIFEQAASSEDEDLRKAASFALEAAGWEDTSRE